MNTTVTIAVTAVIVGFIVYRSATWRSISLAKLTRLPIIFTVVGVGILAMTVKTLGAGWRPAGVDVAVLGAELALAVGVGWAMGRLCEFCTVSGSVRSRLRPVGVVVFVGFIAVRIAGTVVDGDLHGTAQLVSASMMLVVAVLKFTQGLVIRESLAAHTTDVAPAPAAEPQLSLR